MLKPLYIRVRELNKRVVKSDHIKFCVRIDDLLHLSDDKYIDYYTEQLDCFDSMGKGEQFVVVPPDNQQGLSFFPIGEYRQRLCPLSGVPMKNKIYKAIQFVKEYEVEQKKKEIELDFED